MSSSGYAAALRLEFKPSRLRRQWLWLVHLAAALTLPLLPTPGMAAAIAGLLLLSLYHTRRTPVITLLWDSAGRWTWYEDGVEVDAVLAGRAFIQPWLVVLPLRRADAGRVRPIAVFPDMLTADTFRHLRVRLRSATQVDAAPEP
ncbi:MAG: protein YgfX [Gammaproteobacteria bacterium]